MLLGALLTLLLLLLLLLLLPRRRVSLTEDLFKWADFCEIHIALDSPRVSIGPHIFSPKEIGDQLVGRDIERLEFEQVLHIPFSF